MLLKIVEHPVFRNFLLRTRISKDKTRNDLLRSAATAGKRWKLWNKPKNQFCFSILEDTIFLSDDEDDRDPDLTKIDQNGKFCSNSRYPYFRKIQFFKVGSHEGYREERVLSFRMSRSDYGTCVLVGIQLTASPEKKLAAMKDIGRREFSPSGCLVKCCSFAQNSRFSKKFTTDPNFEGQNP